MLKRTMLVGLSVLLMTALIGSVSGAVLWEDDFETYEDGTTTVGGGALGPNGSLLDGYTQFSRTQGRPLYATESNAPVTGSVSPIGGGGSNDYYAYHDFGTAYSTGVFTITSWLRAKNEGGAHSGAVGLDIAGGDTDNALAVQIRKTGNLWGIKGTHVQETTQTSGATTGFHGWDLFQLTVDLDTLTASAVRDPNNDGDFSDATVTLSVVLDPVTIGMFGLMANDDGGPDNVVVEWVPEPVSLSILVLGGSLVICRRRRRLV